MDPVSIIGLISSVGKCIQPFLACLRAISEYRQIDRTIASALKKTVLYCERLELSLGDLRLIDESSISSGHKDFLRRTLDEFRAAVLSHRAEVDSWVLRLGLTDEVALHDASDNTDNTDTKRTPMEEPVTGEANPGCFVVSGWRLRIFSLTGRSRKRKRKTKNITSIVTNVVESASVPIASEKDDEASSQSKYIRMNKLQFVIIGVHNVNKMTENLEFWNNLLSSGVISAIGSLVFKTPTSPNVPVRVQLTHPIARFIVQAKKREVEGRNVIKISNGDWQEHYSEPHLEYIDDNTGRSTAQYQIMAGDAVPQRLEEVRGFDLDTGKTVNGLPEFRNCVFVDRGLWSENSEENTLRLARLFAGEDESVSQTSDSLFRTREDGDMLRCVAALRVNKKSFLVFQLPQGSATGPRTLRTTLLDQRGVSQMGGYPLHPLADRAKLAVRLATAVLVIHSLGLVHKRINPETILMVESAVVSSSQRFPRRLGYPYLIAFHTTRRDLDPTDCLNHTMDARRRAIYYHPRDQEERRKDRYRMLDDIFSLGVCLIEIALWRSLFVWDSGEREYVHDDSFAELSDACGKWDGMNRSEKAEARTKELIRVAEELIPGTMGPIYAKAVVACLKAGAEDSPFASHPALKVESEHPAPITSGELMLVDSDDTLTDNEAPKPVSISYLELVLQNLQAVHKSLTNVAS